MPIDFRIRDYARPLALLKLRRTLERTQWLPAAQLEAYQAARLRRVLRQAGERSPYYRRLFSKLGFRPDQLEHPRQLEALPVLTKDALRESADAIVAENARDFGLRWESTSGTSGAPVRFVLDRGARALEFCYYWRHWSWAGYRLGDRFAELGSVHFLSSRRDADALTHWQPHLRRLMVNSTRVGPDRARDLLAAFRKHRPRFLKGMASALQHLAGCLDQHGEGGWPFTAVFSTGEVVTPASRAAIERAFHCRLFDSYGHMERTVAISQCERGSYHVHSDYGLLELLDRRRSAADEEFGRVTGTGLYNMAMPLVRYDVGDGVELHPEPQGCPCGRGLPVVKAVHGRCEDVIRTPDGRWITAIHCLVEPQDGVRLFQVHHESPTRVRLLVVPSAGWNEDHAEALHHRGGRMLGPGMSFEVTACAESDLARSPTGKLRPLIGLENLSAD